MKILNNFYKVTAFYKIILTADRRWTGVKCNGGYIIWEMAEVA